MTVHVMAVSPTTEKVPAVFVDQIAKRHEHKPGKGHVEKNVDVGFLVLHINVLAEEA